MKNALTCTLILMMALLLLPALSTDGQPDAAHVMPGLYQGAHADASVTITVDGHGLVTGVSATQRGQAAPMSTPAVTAYLQGNEAALTADADILAALLNALEAAGLTAQAPRPAATLTPAPTPALPQASSRQGF